MDPARWRRLRVVLEETVDCPPDARAARLDRAGLSADDRRAVEALLAHHDAGTGFLETAPTMTSGWDGADAVQPGDTLGAYRITREVGRGGMGIVYEAYDARLHRAVAIKVLPESLALDPRRRARLEREARAAAAVQHPGIGHVYALEEDAHHRVYMVSELVAGRTLRDELAGGALAPDLAVGTALQVARALAAAHARGVVHRDLKPDNIMRAPDGTVKVLDFGLARFSQGPAIEPLTRLGEVMGTPAYMSPEQLRGEESGAATDIFAFGVLLRELLTGHHQGASLPPALTAVWPTLPRIIDRCLASAPGDRYASMDEVVQALAGLGATTPRPAISPPATRVRTWWQVHQGIISALYILMIAPAWFVRGGEVTAAARNRLVMAVVLMATLVTTVRLHWVFTARVEPGQLAAVRRRALPWLRAFEWGMTLVLLSGAIVAFNGDRLLPAALLLTVAVSARLAAHFIEPATWRAAFEPDDE
jgi:eukaryotic-like serine/threonine-protein kinase